MSRKLSHFLLLVAVALAVAIVPIACSSDNNPADSGSDAIVSSTRG